MACIAGHNHIQRKISGKTGEQENQENQENQGESFEMFQKWIKFDETEEMEICMSNIPDLDEKYQHSYRIEDKESINRLWDALKKRTYIPIHDYDEPRDAPFFYIRMENYTLNRAVLFGVYMGTDGKDGMSFAPLMAVGDIPIEGEVGEYLGCVYEMDEGIVDIVIEVINENIKSMNPDSLYQCIKEEKLTYHWVQHYYYTGAKEEDQKEVYQKLDFGLEGCDENIVEIPLEEGGKIILQYNNATDITKKFTDQSIHYAVLIKPDGEKIDLLEKDAKEKLETWMQEQ